MAREISGDLQTVIGRCTRRTTLKITLGDGTILPLATGDIFIVDQAYLGKLAPLDALNLEMTATVEGLSLKISNITRELGRNLINTPDVLQGTSAILGCYFFDPETEDEWHDEKLSGIIETSNIDGDWVSVFFKSKVSATEFAGVSIGSVFPDSEVPAAEIPPAPAPIYNDILTTPVETSGTFRSYDPYFNNYREGRYVLPELMFLA